MDDMAILVSDVDGGAYGRPQGTSDELLTKVGPGTPCGEWFRRYWVPVLTSDHVTDTPQEIRILGEDLIIFRDGDGRVGLLYPHCVHRGTSLFYGRVESDGIRCCYHGWKFDVEGHCLEQPCEPKGGVNKDRVRQPWYPVREHYGLIWAYMGPPDKMPLLPRFQHMEPLAEDEYYWTMDNSGSAHADPNGPAVLPYSWMHMNDNAVDPFHVWVLHSTFSGTQFVADLAEGPAIKFWSIDHGIAYSQERTFPDGRRHESIVSWYMPNIAVVPSLSLSEGAGDRITFVVPVDDTHCRNLGTGRFKRQAGSPYGGTPLAGTEFEKITPWSQMTPEERRAAPNDYEAQAGMGPIARHSEEHLVSSDRGVGMQRRLLKREIERVAQGENPAGTAFLAGDEWVTAPSGNFFR